jgi:glutamate-1-semialdehyde 2,1-aminomutase
MRKNSKKIYEAACAVTPSGVNSPVRAFPGLEMTPLIVEDAKGDTLRDVDGHEYIDYCCSWGALILGHAHPRVVEAAVLRVQRGSSFGISTSIEEQLASHIVGKIPSIEKIRFVSSGTEATMSAIRLARGFTGRSLIVKFTGHYHGHADHLLVQAGSGAIHLPQNPSTGVPQEFVQHTRCLPFNDIETCRAFLRSHPQVAAVILEPIACNMGVVPATSAFLHMLREETAKIGALLILDEVITGFRVGLQSAQGLYGIQPDLTCLGKIIGGGFPAAAFGGSSEIMHHLAPMGNVYQAGTLSGNPVAMSAGLETLLEVEKPDFYSELEAKTNLITLPLQEALSRKKINACVQQAGSLFTLFFGLQKVTSKEDLSALDENLYKQFFCHLFERGIYIAPSPYEACFISSAHTTQNLERTRDAMLEFIDAIRK